jgi:hypothetical protein
VALEIESDKVFFGGREGPSSVSCNRRKSRCVTLEPENGPLDGVENRIEALIGRIISRAAVFIA